MTIKQQGGIFGRNPTFNEVNVDTKLTTSDLIADQVGIGVSSPTLPFQLRASSSGAATVASFGNVNILDGLQVTTNGNLDWGFNALNSRSFTVSTNQTERLRVAGTGSGDVTVKTGNLVIGTSGKGIDFSATSGTGTSELFDDYEEGTWTPTFSATGLSGVTIGGGTAGYYTKVGNKVIAWFSIYTTGTFTKGSAALFIAGLPYTSANNAGGQGAVSFHNATRFDALPPIAARVDSNSTSIKLYSSINATGAGTDPVAVSSSNMRSAAAENCNFVSGTVTYMV